MAITSCEKCPRLRAHCLKIAVEKRKSYAGDTYWGRPIPGFGDHAARLVMIGLAPAAHGANRTGRMFTGDRSGDWLYRALFKAGFANQPTSVERGDGLKLADAFVTATAHCAPPGNKPTPAEIGRCAGYLDWELAMLKTARVYLALGKIGFDAVWDVLKRDGQATGSRPAFGHGKSVSLDSGRWLLASYHPSQQNTFTGKLTEPMFDAVFNQVKSLL
ncbi:MAG: uracil-DNA glycosylase [Deltaproteobacteria bacterium]|nr:uracil-DNA glycosylase [Deltaproteobacteria bacterium]